MKRTLLIFLSLFFLCSCSSKKLTDEEIYAMVKENNSSAKLKERFKNISYKTEEEGKKCSYYDDKEKTWRFFYGDKDDVTKTEKYEKDFLYVMNEDASFSQIVVLKEKEDVWAKAEDLLEALEFEAVERTDAFYILSAHVDPNKLAKLYGADRDVVSASLNLICDKEGILSSIQNETLTRVGGDKEVLEEFEVFYDSQMSESEAAKFLEDHFAQMKDYRSCTLILDEEGKERATVQYNIAKGDHSGVLLNEGFKVIGRLSVMDEQDRENDVTYYITDKDSKEMEKEHEGTLSPDNVYSDDASGFVSLSDAVPEVLLEIRYASSYNFVGEAIDGYEQPLALLSRPAASALKKAAQDLYKKGYLLKIYDAYRPQRAVEHFKRWALEINDTRMKAVFYPEVDKKDLFDLGYVASESSHSRGSTVDLTLVDMKTGKEVDMGSTFDLFAEISHSDYEGELSEEQKNNRKILKEAMEAQGFAVLKEEWWHFTLKDEPYPQTYFDFAVSMDSFQ